MIAISFGHLNDMKSQIMNDLISQFGFRTIYQIPLNKIVKSSHKHTEIYTDASPVGISAVLSQNGRIVQFASRALSAVEQRYSQTEREALAITWACEQEVTGIPWTYLR